jgi:beta-lactam-binding protein with PASTA domain
MKFKLPYQDNTLGSLLANVGIVFGALLLLAISYFYIYLPGITNHGESITVPNLQGMKVEELPEFLASHDLRFTVYDSAYSEAYPSLSVLQQLPKPGAKVKEGRMIYVSINRVTPPTLPLPNLTENFSLTGADLILKTNELRRGRIFYKPSPFLNYVMEMRYQGKVATPGTRVPKGAVIDLVIGDGNGPADFKVGSLVGDTYERALFKLMGWNLHLGKVQIPEDEDTTGIEPIVYKQYPPAGDSVRVGDPVNIWIAPKGYQPPPEEIEVKNN